MKRSRRSALAAGAAIGAGALVAPAAHAADFVVTDASDSGGPNTLRDAVTQAEANSEADVITFDPSIHLIRLTSGQLSITKADGLTITGPGASNLTITGDADSSGGINAADTRLFSIGASGKAKISGVTLTGGNGLAAPNGSASGGGAITMVNSGDPTLDLVDSVVTGNSSGSNGGGGVENFVGTLTVTGSTFTSNAAGPPGGGGLGSGDTSHTTITDSTFTGNQTSSTGGAITDSGHLTVTGSTFSGNQSAASGGAISVTNNSGSVLSISDSVISGNTAADLGGGIYFDSKYAGDSTIDGTTISGNHAASGGGLAVPNVENGGSLTISNSTISGNDANSDSGGGIGISAVQSQSIDGPIRVLNSTVSGNTAAVGAGIGVGIDSEQRAIFGANGSASFDNSTIAENVATSSGGGIYLSAYGPPGGPFNQSSTVGLNSTIVADNTAAGTAQDLDRNDASTSGGFNSGFSLIEEHGDAPVTDTATSSNILGIDPQLGALADNGGKTQTQLPAATSPVIDKGKSPAMLPLDQRAATRLVDLAPDNAAGGDGTDIGSVEVQAPPPTPTPPTPTPPSSGGTTPTPPPPTPPAVDKPPTAKITSVKPGAKSWRAAGTATDDKGVKRVEIAVVLKKGKLCSELRANGRFTKTAKCNAVPKTFLKAKGATKWTFSSKHRLPQGSYVLYARAIDTGGHTSTFTSANKKRFNVKK